MNLNDLNLDTLTLVISALCRLSARPRDALLPLSLVSRRLRDATLCWIFRSFQWTLDNDHYPQPVRGTLGARIKTHIKRLISPDSQSPHPFLPINLSPYVKHLILIDARWPEKLQSTVPDHHGQRLQALIHGIPQLTELDTLILRCTIPADINHILAALSALPSLKAVTFRKVPWWAMDEVPQDFPQVDRIIIDHRPSRIQVNGQGLYPDFWHDGKISESSMGRGAARVTPFLLRHSGCVRELEVPARLILVDRVTTVQWSTLRTLVFSGEPPESGGDAFLLVLRAMPQLESLRLVLVHTSTQKAPFILVPPHNRSDGRFRTTLSSLLSLELSNVSEEENIFLHLPARFTSLSLPTICGKDSWPPPMSEASILKILDKVSTSGAQLSRLSLSLENLPSPALIARLSNTFPDLHSLELHQCYGRPTISVHSWDSYIDPLSRFVSLENLWIAMPSAPSGTKDISAWKGFPEHFDDLTACAYLLATHLKNITTLALQYRRWHNLRRWTNEWQRWDVYRAENGFPILEYADPVVSVDTLGLSV